MHYPPMTWQGGLGGSHKAIRYAFETASNWNEPLTPFLLQLCLAEN